MNRYIFALLLLLTACTPATPAATPRVVGVYLSSSASAWRANVYDCASPSTVISLTDPRSADLTLRVGEPDGLNTPAFEIDTEEILVVVDLKAGVDALSLTQVRSLFLGQTTNWKDLGGSDLPVQVWAYASDEDIQQIFSRVVMNGQPVSSLARLAVSAEAMSGSIEATPGSVGILARRWKSGNTPEVYSVATVPVLAITRSEPGGAVRELLGCLQAGH
jgi:periplasmic binding family protein